MILILKLIKTIVKNCFKLLKTVLCNRLDITAYVYIAYIYIKVYADI